MLNSVLNLYIYNRFSDFTIRRNSMFQFRNVDVWIFKCALLRGIKFRLVIITSCFFPNDFIRHPWVTSWLHVDVWNRWIIFFVISFFLLTIEWLSKHNSWTTRLSMKDKNKYKTCFWLINSLCGINYGILPAKNSFLCSMRIFSNC